MRYKKGYKYQLVEDIEFKTTFCPPKAIESHFITLLMNGTLLIRRGYAWDGASGGAIDTDTFMRASCLHDALYQLIRQGGVPHGRWRDADKELERVCLIDGMHPWRVKWVMLALKLADGRAADPNNIKKVYTV